ncbi:MAG: helix-turn-helix transcriptional regulator [Desulfovibrio sp.]|uniref:helix-turn-helix domain-containing protein n=1 Tax=Desulfovibrio sp. TaxID=885 RepID=UPI002A360540|nr:helix-turn-helix transcriptional regulator [Desulfovibrio sp.]MDY0260746.1 helix-turn-helix transcriptional regulator [Desulfovibrio sp.]
MKTLGSRIRFVRGALSQEVFAAKLGISKGSLGGYERDENLPNSDIVLKICQQTNVSVQWLLQGEGLAKTPVDESAPLESSLADNTLGLPRGLGAAENFSTTKSRISLVSDENLIQQECVRCHRLEERLERLEEERRELNEENRQLWKENSILNTKLARLKSKG